MKNSKTLEKKLILYYDNLEIPCSSLKQETEVHELRFPYPVFVSGRTRVILTFSNPYPNEPILAPKEEYWVKADKTYYQLISPTHKLINSYYYQDDANYFTSYYLHMVDPFIETINIPEQTLCIK